VPLVALIVAIAVMLGGCWRQSYERVMGVHVEVLESLAEKLCELAEARRRPAPEEMGEFVYPLRRARQFQRYFAEDGGRPSFRLFDQLLADYGDLVQRVEAARVAAASWEREREALCGARDGIRARAEYVRQALQREARHE